MAVVGDRKLKYEKRMEEINRQMQVRHIYSMFIVQVWVIS